MHGADKNKGGKKRKTRKGNLGQKAQEEVEGRVKHKKQGGRKEGNK